MSSNAPEPLDLDRDLPTSEEDVAALRRLRLERTVSFADYLEQLSRYEGHRPPLRRKPVADPEPFEL